ncbi:hypothetical protein NDU88_000180 [Pleurodeles waltl]|uniref:Uncharacterized protein n=1 Tax=Pleurodeles waltl TaxID=8319 RepID=A0AAV7TE95_PLEWA|nr:hypothetical protein NDU88_000180 [Pleurodeles waltl]
MGNFPEGNKLHGVALIFLQDDLVVDGSRTANGEPFTLEVGGSKSNTPSAWKTPTVAAVKEGLRGASPVPSSRPEAPWDSESPATVAAVKEGLRGTAVRYERLRVESSPQQQARGSLGLRGPSNSGSDEAI